MVRTFLEWQLFCRWSVDLGLLFRDLVRILSTYTCLRFKRFCFNIAPKVLYIYLDIVYIVRGEKGWKF